MTADSSEQCYCGEIILHCYISQNKSKKLHTATSPGCYRQDKNRSYAFKQLLQGISSITKNAKKFKADNLYANANGSSASTVKNVEDKDLKLFLLSIETVLQPYSSKMS